MTKKEATENIEAYKNQTAYFGGGCTLEEFQNMLRHEMHFGLAETMVISSAMVKAGAFKK